MDLAQDPSFESPRFACGSLGWRYGAGHVLESRCVFRARDALEVLHGFVQLGRGLGRIALHPLDALGELGELGCGAAVARIDAHLEGRELNARLHYILLERLDLLGRKLCRSDDGGWLWARQRKGAERSQHAAQRRGQGKASRQHGEAVYPRRSHTGTRLGSVLFVGEGGGIDVLRWRLGRLRVRGLKALP